MPQGGIVSPILANIYLDKLDKYVKEYIRHFDMGTKRRPGKESNDLANERKRTVRKLKKVKDGTEKALWSQDSKPSNRNVQHFQAEMKWTEVTAGSNTSVTPTIYSGCNR